jgi:hypothetical protein
MSSVFSERLQEGKIGESRIAKWFIERGFTVLPVYEIEIGRGKGPQLFMPNKELIAPDMFIFRRNDGRQLNCYWIEAKHKSAFSWHRKTNRWVTGIDLKHYEHYCEVDAQTPWPVFLMFLHKGEQAKDSPPNSPKGLFGNSLQYLKKHENHRSPNWGKTGMVYWAIEHLNKVEDYVV